MADPQNARLHAVVINSEEQYSIWPADREPPAGWTPVGFTGPEDECLAYIDEHWTDMRPLSLRNWIRDNEQPASN